MTCLLVVEDEPHTQAVMRKLLTRLGGFEVVVSEDPVEGLQLVASGRIDLVVMDVSLERTVYQGRPLDGVSYTRLIKAQSAGRLVPILLATAYALPGEAERLLEASGADGYVAKPFADPSVLVEAVRRLLDRSQR